MAERDILLKEIITLTQNAEFESPGFEQRQDRQFPVIIPPATLGFEFDINYGSTANEPPPAAADYDMDGEEITNHNRATDGFKLKGDGNRIEISTKPFSITAAGKKEMLEVARKIKKMTNEVEKLCLAAPFHLSTDNDTYKKNSKVHEKVVGRPKAIKYSKLLPKIKSIFPIEGQHTYYRQKLCGVAASPQATIAVPLGKIEALIKKIKASESLPKSSFSLSGRAKYRLGLRSDALYKALAAVNKSRTYHLRNKTSLTGNKKVSSTNYTPELQGLLILMVSYLITSELKADLKDYESYAKAYLPLNVKHHFRLLLSDLSTEEKQVFKELYFDGVKQFNIFKLAKPTADKAFASAQKLFPVKATDWTFYFKDAPTWMDFLTKTFNNTPLLREVIPTESNPKHKVGDETLFNPISNSIPYIAHSKRVIVEMRRIGTRMIPAAEWEKLMLKIFKLTEALN